MDYRYQLEELPMTVSRFWSDYGHKRIFAFYGAMGAGKTTFIRELSNYLGVTESVSSPTFSLINEYEGHKGVSIYHADLYRIKNLEEALDAGVAEVLTTDAICLIEWPGILENELPGDTVRLYFETIDTYTRKLEVKING
jgi:tRNA threonylcarbamoyladenosine biosynthesis protein TsaE